MKEVFSKTVDNFSVALELIAFFWRQKLWWMLPLIFLILLLAIFLIFIQGAAVVPFVYTLI